MSSPVDLSKIQKTYKDLNYHPISNPKFIETEITTERFRKVSMFLIESFYVNNILFTRLQRKTEKSGVYGVVIFYTDTTNTYKLVIKYFVQDIFDESDPKSEYENEKEKYTACKDVLNLGATFYSLSGTYGGLYAVIMDCYDMSLLEYSCKIRDYSNEEKARIYQQLEDQILTQMLSLEDIGYYYRDLHRENILVSFHQSPRFVLCDYGSITNISEKELNDDLRTYFKKNVIHKLL